MMRSDNSPMHKLFEEFSMEDIIAVMNDYTQKSNVQATPDKVIIAARVDEPEKLSDDISDEQQDELLTPAEAILNFLKNLEGVRTNLKEIHWSTKKTSVHNITSDFMKAVDEMEDEIAEDMQGLYGIRICIGQLVPVEWHKENLDMLIIDLLDLTITLKASINGVPGLSGVVSILDDFMHKMNKFGYLKTMEC